MAEQYIQLAKVALSALKSMFSNKDKPITGDTTWEYGHRVDRGFYKHSKVPNHKQDKSGWSKL